MTSAIKHAVCCLVLMASAAPAANVLVLKSQSSEPYNQAVNGFRAACGADITEVNLGGNKSRKTEFLKRMTEEKSRVVVAVGPLAAQVAQGESTGVPLVFLMVSNPGRHGLQGNNIAGVSLDI